MTAPVLSGEGLTVTYREQPIIRDVSLRVRPDARILIQGPSGSGKSTLFEVLGLLNTPTEGRLLVDGTDVGEASGRTRAQLRRETIGTIFQEFHLIPDLTAWENAAVPQDHHGNRDEAWLETLFDELGIRDLASQYPATLSGGEKQRVALARALANKPDIVLADEPTGQLDPETAERVLELLFELQEFTETALLVISHDRRIASDFRTVYRLADGRLHKQSVSSTVGSSPAALQSDDSRDEV